MKVRLIPSEWKDKRVLAWSHLSWAGSICFRPVKRTQCLINISLVAILDVPSDAAPETEYSSKQRVKEANSFGKGGDLKYFLRQKLSLRISGKRQLTLGSIYLSNYDWNFEVLAGSLQISKMLSTLTSDLSK